MPQLPFRSKQALGTNGHALVGNDCFQKIMSQFRLRRHFSFCPTMLSTVAKTLDIYFADNQLLSPHELPLPAMLACAAG